MSPQKNPLFIEPKKISRAAFDKIVCDTGIPLVARQQVRLRSELNLASFAYHWTKEREARPPPSVQFDTLRKIEEAAGQLLDICGFDGTSAPIEPQYSMLVNLLLERPDPLHKVPRYLHNGLIEALTEYAKQYGAFIDMPAPVKANGLLGEGLDYHAKEKLASLLNGVLLLRDVANAAKNVQHNKVGRNPPHQGDQTISFVVSYLSEVYEKIYGREPAVSRTGPFARFLSACFLAFGEHPAKATPSSLAQRWSRIREKLPANL